MKPMKVYYAYLYFVRRVYKRRWIGYSNSANSLALACILFFISFIFSCFDSFLSKNSIIQFKIPIAPIAALVYLTLHLIILNALKALGIRITRLEISKIIYDISRTPRYYSIIYVSVSSLLFIVSLAMLYLNRLY